MEASMSLTGKLLIAMPGMGDMRFDRSVILICAHSEEGAMGLILNKPTPDLRLRDLLEQLSIAPEEGLIDMPVHFGGPVEHGRGFVLHTQEYASALSTLSVEGGFAMTATLDVLEELARGEGPKRAIMALGYAGWGPGQLENEILHNGWLTTEATPELVFDAQDGRKWEAALKSLGVDARALSGMAGRA